MTVGTTANARRTVHFNGTFEAEGDSYLAVYGCKAIPPTTPMLRLRFTEE
jgi:hypothetical protein